MFTEDVRDRLQAALVARAVDDGRVGAAALVGSGATGAQDAWSDIDLALRLEEDADRDAVVSDWTAAMHREHGAVDHLDVWRGETLYRVFLLADTLQVDVSFWAFASFGATGPRFRLLFGAAPDRVAPAVPDPSDLVGWAWLYALHARSAIARDRPWQAEYMIAGVRDRVLALACLRHDLPASDARGADELPSAVVAPLEAARPRDLTRAALLPAFAAASAALVREAGFVDARLVQRIGPVLDELVASAAS